MVCSRDDRTLIRELRESKGYGAKRLLMEFPMKNCRFHLTNTVATQQSRPQSIDYKIWGVLQERVYRVRIHDVDHLKRRLVEEWAQFEQTIIDDIIKQWRQRLC